MDGLPADPESEGGVLAAGDDEAVCVSRHLLTYCTLFLTFSRQGLVRCLTLKHKKHLTLLAVLLA